MSNKCICEQYKSCKENPQQRVSAPVGDMSGEEFTAKADLICPGTRVFIDSVKARESLVIEGDEARLSLDALHFECKYWETSLR